MFEVYGVIGVGLVATPYSKIYSESKVIIILGHGYSLQASVLVSIPTQGTPPNLGVGFEQVLREMRVPPPQLSEQASFGTQGDHAPWAKTQFCATMRSILNNVIMFFLLGTGCGSDFRFQFGLMVVPSMMRAQVTFTIGKTQGRYAADTTIFKQD